MTTINSKSDLNRAVANALHPEPPASERRAIHESGVWRWARYHTPVTRNEWGRWEPADFATDPVASFALEQKMDACGWNWDMEKLGNLWMVTLQSLKTYLALHESRFIAMALAALRDLEVEFELVEGWDQR